MVIYCECGAEIKFADSALKRGIPNIQCKSCQRTFKPNIPKPEKKEKSENDEGTKSLFEDVGWLVVHDEKTPPQTLSLKMGKQVVGRISAFDNKKADLMIDTKDDSMSRQHFIITVERSASGGYSYYLSDNNAINKTFLNTKELKKGDEYMLKDGNTIQAGLTKIVFKSNNKVKDKQEATKIVADQPKTKTVLVFDS